MAANTKQVKKDVDRKPSPQYYNPVADEYEYLYGENGASRHILYSSDGQPITSSGNKLAVRASEIETLLSDIKSKDFATQTTLAAILSKIVAAPATEAKQTALNTLIGEVQVAPTANTLLARLKNLETKVDAIIADGVKLSGSKAEQIEEATRSIVSTELLDGDFYSDTTCWVNSMDYDYKNNVLWSVFSSCVLSHSLDGGRNWIRDIEVDGVTANIQGVVVIPTTGTVIATGYNPSGAAPYDLKVWRKASNSDEFTSIATGIEVYGSVLGSISAGKLGVASYFYGGTIKKFEYTIDDGLTWQQATLTPVVLAGSHLHGVHVDKYEDFVYVTCGDDKATGTTGCYRSPDWATWTQIYSELSGFRVVPVTGNIRYRALGVEGLCGGVLVSYNDSEWEVAMGKVNSEYFGFNDLIATDDGLLIGGTYSYRNRGDDNHYGHAGSIWISGDDGHTAMRIPTGAKAVTALAYHNGVIWAGFGANSGVFYNTPYMMRIVLKDRMNLPYLPQSTKLVLHDDADHVNFAKNATTMVVNMSGYSKLSVFIRTWAMGATGQITIQASPYYKGSDGVQLDVDTWFTVATVPITTASMTTVIDIPAPYNTFAQFRFKNTGSSDLKCIMLGFTGKN